MNGNFKTSSDWIRYHMAEGFTVGNGKCRKCSETWLASIANATKRQRLQCPRCGNTSASFVPFLKVPQ